MKVSLTQKTAAIVIIVAISLVWIGAYTLSLSLERLENSQTTSKQFQLVQLLDSVVLDLNRAEDRENDYILSGNKTALESYRFYFRHIDESVAQLRRLLSDNSRYLMLMEELSESISFRHSCAEEVVKQRDIAGMEAALQRSKTFDESRLTKHVEWLAKDVSRTIIRELTDRFSHLHQDSVTSMIGITALLCSALFLLVAGIYFVNRWVQDRYFAEKSLREAQQALSEREARMRALVDTAPDGIVTIRTSGRIESANAVFGQMMGCDLTNIVERDIQTFIPGFLAAGSEALNDNRHGQGETRPFGAVRELIAVRDNGDRFAVEVSVSVVNLGKYDVYTGIVRDITERKEVEERVKDFYSMVSHELRTPLASIRTALGIMENTAGDQASNQANLVVRIAANETDRLMRLINDILDMRKVESGKLDLIMDVLDARTIVERAVDGVKGLAIEAKLTIETRVEPGLELYCDEDRTLQVLTNFLANAIKFSPVGASITVECQGIGNRCRFAVTDQGPGVPKAQIHKLFGRFEQLRSTDGKQRPGSGLGLAIAKSIVEQHGGQIGVEQPEEGGSTFWFSLPLARDEDDEPLEQVTGASSAGPITVVAEQNMQDQPVVAVAIAGPVENAVVKTAKGRKSKKFKRS
jgi:PAS domain S-box-containing protein